MSEVDDQIARARAAMNRIATQYDGVGAGGSGRRYPHYGGRNGPRRQAQLRDVSTRVKRILLADAALLVLAVAIGFFTPIGIFGFLAVIALLAVTTVVLAMAPTERPVQFERLRESDIKALPAQTERWLQAQRPQLPAPAATLVDRIGVRLETLSPQLARVGNDTPEAGEVRKLVAEQLPAFVNDYARVPATLRAQERNGRSPDAELVDGLKLIEQEIGDMTQRLAASDLDQLSTRGRFLEMKYKDEER